MDSRTKLTHSVAARPVNVHDSQILAALLHGKETRVWGDKAYAGQRKAILAKAPYARDFTQKKGIRNQPLSNLDQVRSRTRSKIGAKVEHPIGASSGCSVSPRFATGD